MRPSVHDASKRCSILKRRVDSAVWKTASASPGSESVWPTVIFVAGDEPPMTNIDQFESVFRSADKPVFELQPMAFDRVLVVTDVDKEASAPFVDEAKTLLSETATKHSPDWRLLPNDEFASVPELIEQIERLEPDLLCTYRNLKNPSIDFPYSLGTYLDVMTQATSVPVLVLPRPENETRKVPDNTDSVMVITDHLTGDDRIVSVAVNLTEPGGTVLLSHVEDERQLKKYLATISKIPSLNTATAEQSLRDQLMKEPQDYVDSVRKLLQKTEIDIQIECVVQLGNQLEDYRRLIGEHKVDLLVINTKDEDQLAMHGVAYPLTVELRSVPMLLL